MNNVNDNEQRIEQEKKVIRKLVEHMAAHGWVPCSANDGGDEDFSIQESAEAVLEVTSSVDEAWIMFKKEKCLSHGIFFVMGNSPDEVICDFGSYRDDRDGFRKAVESFDAEKAATS